MVEYPPPGPPSAPGPPQAYGPYQPGWHQPPPGPGPGPKTSRTLLVGIVLVVAIVVAVAVAVVALGGGDDTDGAGSPASGRSETSDTRAGPADDSGGGPGASGAPGAAATSGDEPDANGNLPVDVVANLLTASTEADCETLAASLSGWTEEDVATCRSTRTPNPNPATVLNVELEGFYPEPDPDRPGMEPGTAVIIATMDYNRGPGDWEHWLRLEDGVWKVYNDIAP
jgi:hypothetical protein